MKEDKLAFSEMRELAERWISEFLPSRLHKAARNSLLPSVRITLSGQDDENAPVGSSKWGGRPDLPADWEWPYWYDAPLAFIAQFNCVEVSKHDAEKVLPSQGLLSFFYETREQPWGFSPEDWGGWKVAYFPEPTRLQRRDAPVELDEDYQVLPHAVSLQTSLMCPPYGSRIVERWQLTREEQDAYWQFEEKVRTFSEYCEHRLLGHPSQVQGEMQTECEIMQYQALRNVGVGLDRDPNPKSSPDEKVAEWRLLFQVDSDGSGPPIGDGFFYYWIRESDLKARNFDHTWLILQCT